MAILHQATLTPTKPEALAAWLPTQPWAPDHGELEIVGAFRFDDPAGEVGLEVHLARLDGVLLQAPLTYRSAPLPDADDHLVTTMHHTVLGARWVYDGLHDPVFTAMLAAAALTGTGQAVSLVEIDGRSIVIPNPVRIDGGGWTGGRVAVDRLVPVATDGTWAVLRSDALEVRVARRPEAAPVPSVGLTATWEGQPEPVVLAEVANS
jgi:hypothetical protein